MKRLVDTPADGSETGRLLRALPPPEPPPGARARVWRKVSEAPGQRRRRAWVLVPALAAAALLALVISSFRASRPAPPAMPGEPPVLALSSGMVEQPAASRVRTGPGSRALVRVGAAAVLLAEDTEVEISSAEVAVFRGRVAVATASGDASPLVLKAGDQAVSGSGMFAAVLVDSRRFERAEVTSEERALLGRFGRGAGPESRLRVEAPEGYAVGIDGAQVGRSPLRALVPLGPRALSGRRPDGARLSGEATVEAGRETLYVLREPVPVPVQAPAPAPPLPHRRPAPKVAPPSPVEVAAPPEATGDLVPPSVALSPRPSDAATTADPDVEAYAKAKELLARGDAAGAAALFSDVARGHSSRAELSLYELGRTQLRSLRDPAAARKAFSSYLERYPGGLLLQEVELSLIESELATSDLPAARASMDRFLASHPRSERRDEVLLLRANLDRDRGDCASALDRYRALARGTGAVADDATYFAAACAQQMGRMEEARALLQESLQRFPAGRHAEEARRALSGR
ncbi:MAG TPA: outer membrane protein assembly factor BamD [Myxococcales bacterium]|nr:outer membrane protein assembly factor BamD [Myxococcales bacterium]